MASTTVSLCCRCTHVYTPNPCLVIFTCNETGRSPCPFYFREWIWEYKTGEARLWSRGTVEPLYRGNHLCTSVCVLHREVYLIQIRSTSLGLQAVSSIERCPPFTLLHMLHCIQIHIAIQIPSQVTLYSDSYCDSDSFTGYTVCTHHCPTPLLANLLLVFTSC